MKNSLPKRLVWLHGDIKTPPFSPTARLEAGILLRRLQDGETLGMPHSRPMRTAGPACHELRIVDENNNWRIIYHLSEDAVVLLDVFAKKSGRTPTRILRTCRHRLANYLSGLREPGE
jgi:phage-related protein